MVCLVGLSLALLSVCLSGGGSAVMKSRGSKLVVKKSHGSKLVVKKRAGQKVARELVYKKVGCYRKSVSKVTR